MKDRDKFYPHAILRHPATSDEAVWNLINRTSSRDGRPVILLIEPPLPLTRKGGRLSHASWPVSEKPEKPTARESSKPKTQK